MLRVTYSAANANFNLVDLHVVQSWLSAVAASKQLGHGGEQGSLPHAGHRQGMSAPFPPPFPHFAPPRSVLDVRQRSRGGAGPEKDLREEQFMTVYESPGGS